MQVGQQETWIKERAYAIWEQEGCPSGREAQHWFRAAAEIESLIALPAVEQVTPATAKTRRTPSAAAQKSRPAKSRRAVA